MKAQKFFNTLQKFVYKYVFIKLLLVFFTNKILKNKFTNNKLY